MNEKRKQVIEKLLERIQSGDIVSNNKLLPERQLAEVIGETRPVLREGLIALDAMGVVDIRDRQGIFLSSHEENETSTMLQKMHGWPVDILSRAMEVRQIIEPIATGIAAYRRSEKDLEKMRACLEHMEELSQQSGQEAADKGAYWNTALHSIIIDAAGNSYLSRIYESVITAIEQGMSMMRINTPPAAEGGRFVAFREHVELYETIKAQDIRGAELCCERNLKHTINARVQVGRIVPSSNLFEQKFAGLLRGRDEIL